MSSKSNAVSNLIKIIGIALIATALYQELRKPPEERKWHGKILGFIPYEFRKPSIERLRERLWNPDDPRIFTEHVFGVGFGFGSPKLMIQMSYVKFYPQFLLPF